MSNDKKTRVILLAKYGLTVFLFVSMSLGTFAYSEVGFSLSQSLVHGIFEGVVFCIVGVLILASDKWDPTRLILLSNYNLNMKKGIVASLRLLPGFLLLGCIIATVKILASQTNVLEVFYESIGLIVFGQILVFLLESIDQQSFRSTFELKSRVYKGVYNACFVGLVSTLIISGFYWILSDRVQALSAGITGGLLMGLYYGGGVGVIQHFVLRCIVSFINFLPFKMRTFFDICVAVGILQKTGMKYRFLHKIIQEYFVGLAN